MGAGLVDFYSLGDDIKTNLPITRYRGEITEVTKLDSGAIAFTESLPLGSKQQRLISSDSFFLGTLEEAIKFYSSELVTVGSISAIETLAQKINDLETSLANSEIAINSYSRQLESSAQKINDLETSLANSEIAPIRYQIEQPQPNTSLSILGRFA